jgi:hypothetical protein
MKPLPIAAVCAAAFILACGSESPNNNSLSNVGNGSVGVATDTGAVSNQADSATAALTKIVVNTELSVEVTHLRDAYAAASGLARSAGGFVADSRISDGDEAAAFLRLRIPAEQHDGVLASLRGLGDKVTREQTTAKEVTAEYTDLQSRLVNLSRAEAQYQTLLDRAGSIDEVLKVTTRLDSVRGDIEQVQGRANLLEDQSDFATIALTLSLPPPAAKDNNPGRLPSPITVFVNAFKASLSVGHAVLNVSAVLLVVAIWAIPALVAFAVLRQPVTRVVEASKRLRT